MKVASAFIIVSAALAGCAEVRGTVRVEQATAGKPYDFVVHVKTARKLVTIHRSQVTVRPWRWRLRKGIAPPRALSDRRKSLLRFMELQALCSFRELRDRFEKNISRLRADPESY